MRRTGIMIALLLMISLASCETTTSLEFDVSETLKTQQAGLVPTQMLGGYKASFGISRYSHNNGVELEPVALLRQDLDVLPDPLKTASGQGDSIQDGILHVDALDVNFVIPEGYYVYRIPGEYLDVQNGRNVTLDFVDEYVFTVREVDADILKEDIRDYLKRTHNSNDAAYRGPGYVVWDFRVFHQKYLPIENLFVSALADTGEYFEKDDYYCSVGRRLWRGPSNDGRDPDGGMYVQCFYDAGEIYNVRKLPGYWEEGSLQAEIDAGLLIREENWPVEDWIGSLIEATNQHALITESFTQPILNDSAGPMSLAPLMYTATTMYKSGPAACVIEDELVDGRLYTWISSCPDASPLSAKWQEAYRYALMELKDHPEEYEYPEVRYTFQEEYSTLREKPWWVTYDKKLRQGWGIDPKQDNALRAAVYADLITRYSDVDLKRIMILMKNTEEERLFGAYYLDEKAPYTMSAVMLSWDAISGMDLDFLREYGETFLFVSE